MRGLLSLSGPVRALCLLVAAGLLIAARCPQGAPVLPPLAGPRMVLATGGPAGSIETRMSLDGEVWSAPRAVATTPPTVTAGPVELTFESGFYHLYWIDRAGGLRYATSRDGVRWLAQGEPFANLPAGSAVDFARGQGRSFAAVTTGGGLTVQSLDNPTQRTSVASGAQHPATLAFGAGKFVLAAATPTSLLIFESSDGASWTPAATLPFRLHHSLRLDFAEGQFLLAAKESGTGGGELPVSRCKLYTSSDGRAWTSADPQPCSNTSTGVAATRFEGKTLYLENFDNRFLRTSIDGAAFADTNAVAPIGVFDVTAGPGPQIAGLRLLGVEVFQGEGQDVSVVTLGFQARVGRPGSANVWNSGRLSEIAVELDVGERVTPPPWVSPNAWLFDQAERLLDEDGQLDIMGAVVVGIERGNCPTGPIVSRLQEVRNALAIELESKIAGGTLGELRDPTSRQAVLDSMVTAVKGRLGDGSTSFWEDLGCGFNVDEALQERVVVLLGGFVPDDPPNNVFRLKPEEPSTIQPALRLRSRDGDEEWRVASRLDFRGIP